MTCSAHNIPFEFTHRGKCDTCQESKYLDSMVRKQYKKGLYECIDCKVETEAKLIENYPMLMLMKDNDEVQMKAKTFKKLIKKLMG